MFKYVFAIALTLTQGSALALPPEGIDAWGIYGAGELKSTLFVSLGYVNPIWTTDYQSLWIYGGKKTFESGFTSYGGALSVSNEFSDRDAYFVSHDFLLLDGTSLALKWAHEDLRHLKTSFDTFALDFNTYKKWTETSGIYFNIGLFHKFHKHEWNKPWWMPFNLDTNDSGGFISAVLGVKSGFGEKSFWTFDLNNRDPFAYYSTDHVALDLTFNLATSNEGFYWRLLTGYRVGGFWVGSASLADYHVFFGMVAQ